MLLKPSDDIRDYDGHAMERDRRPDSAPTADSREFLGRWNDAQLFLAHSYEFSDRSRFTASYRGTR
jgi:hypothetical protein